MRLNIHKSWIKKIRLKIIIIYNQIETLVFCCQTNYQYIYRKTIYVSSSSIELIPLFTIFLINDLASLIQVIHIFSQVWKPIDFNIFITGSIQLSLSKLMFPSGSLALSFDFTTTQNLLNQGQLGYIRSIKNHVMSVNLDATFFVTFDVCVVALSKITASSFGWLLNSASTINSRNLRNTKYLIESTVSEIIIPNHWPLFLVSSTVVVIKKYRSGK